VEFLTVIFRPDYDVFYDRIEPHNRIRRRTAMKKLMTLMLGLAFLTGTVATAQEKAANTKSAKKKAAAKKKTQKKVEKK
jgi:hypothetical protein